MKLSEKTISMWTVVQLHKNDAFKNPSFAGKPYMVRITSIKKFNSWDLRFWKEFFMKYKESNSKDEIAFVPDCEKQIDQAIEEEMDQ